MGLPQNYFGPMYINKRWTLTSEVSLDPVVKEMALIKQAFTVVFIFSFSSFFAGASSDHASGGVLTNFQGGQIGHDNDRTRQGQARRYGHITQFLPFPKVCHDFDLTGWPILVL